MLGLEHLFFAGCWGGMEHTRPQRRVLQEFAGCWGWNNNQAQRVEFYRGEIGRGENAVFAQEKRAGK
jgi:hypothetical protein